MSTDPLLQPYRLKHLTLRNRIMTTSHEPAYTEDGMPKDRYRLYHLERAKAGVAMVMTAGSASVSRDSPPAFGNVLVWKDEVVPWMRRLADDCHEAGAAVMIQISHLGRRTRWDKGDWLPVVAPGPSREPAHRAFPKIIEDWDIARIIADYADAAERMQAAGLDGVEFECYGHLMDQFISALTNGMAPGPYDASSLDNRLRFATQVLQACRDRVGPNFLLGVRYVADEDEAGGIPVDEGVELARRFRDAGLADFVNIIRGRIHTDAALTGVIPIQGMRSAPHLDLAGRIRAEIGLPTFHAARIPDVATARHAVAEGILDMVGMTRAHMADPISCKKSSRAASTTSAPASAPPTASTASTRAAWRSASTTPPPGAKPRCPTASPPRRSPAKSSSSAPAPPAWKPPASPPNAATPSPCSRSQTSPAARSASPPCRNAGPR